MKTDELQIGNFVYYNGIVHRVTYISDFDGIARVVCVNDEASAFTKNVEPIPLTAEILEKNGWRYEDFSKENNDDERYYLYNGFDIHINKDKFEIRCIDSVDIELKYVHELQNILKLTKIEKEIKI